MIFKKTLAEKNAVGQSLLKLTKALSEADGAQRTHKRCPFDFGNAWYDRSLLSR